MVFAFSPDSLPMFRKLMPSCGEGGAGAVFCGAPGDCARAANCGRIPAKRFSRDRTSAERLSDLRKLRRGEYNRSGTFLDRSGPESVWLWRGFDACYTLAVSSIDSLARVCKRAALSKVSHAD